MEKRVRNLTKTFAAVSLVTPMGAYALGVGDIKLHSALNQNLDAEIALVLSDAEKLGDVKVKLAPPSKFEEAGVPWSHFLSQIKFKTITKPNGAVVVKLTSDGVLQEPFLDFLLEVSWPKGDIYREFTVLVDPPAVYQQQVIPVASNPSESPKLQPSTYANVTNASKGISTKSISQSYSGVDEYGPTGSRDTLWKIAEKVIRNKDISVEQMMIALYEANPEAFYKPNVNALSSGVTLRVPDDNVVMRLSDRQAKQAFAKQVSAWRGKVTTASSSSTSKKNNNAPVVSNQLQLKAPTEAEINDRVMVTPGVDQDLQGSNEISDEAVSFSQENKELKNRLDKLEEQLVSMQKMLVVKDEQLADLQSKELKQESKKLPEQSVVKQGETAKPQVAKQAVKPKPKPLAQPLPENESDSSLYNIIMGTAAIGALGLLGLVWWRKRKAEDEINSESMFAASSQISLPETDQNLTVPVADASKNTNSTTTYDVGSVGESSFLSEFTPSDFDAFESDQAEVDPISEADVYLAYGRYQQAEELMRQAIETDPDRDECKLKLLEIFYASENQQAFEKFSGELVTTGKQDDADFWGKVTEMGKELCPENKLFLVQPIIQNDEESNVLAESESAEDEILQPDFSSTNDSLEPEAIANEDDNGLEFDIPSLEDEAVESEDLSLSGETDNNDIDFDLGAIDTKSLKGSEAPVKTNISSDDEVETFDLSAESLSEKDEDDLTNYDFGSDDGKADSSEAKPGLELSETKEQDSTAEDFNFEFDLDQPKSSPKETKPSDLSTVADLTDMDELETKIDLAKAYIDMGDADAAKNIAEEVLEKGTDNQKQEAQEIINQI